MMDMKGYLLAAIAAALYGTNPVFAVPLYGLGMNATSVLLFRYLLGIPLLAIILIWHSERLLLRPNQLLLVSILGLIMGLSSLALYEAYGCMNPGIASTLLFMYPLFTTVIMTLFFHEKFRFMTGISLAVMFMGLYLLMNPVQNAEFNLKGFIWIFISSLTYALYLVMIKVSKKLQTVPNTQSLLLQLLSGSFVFIAASFCGQSLVLPATLFEWGNLAALALFPTVLSLMLTIRAINLVGPTPTALFGALEPVIAVVLSVVVLGDVITFREAIGGVLIICATMLVMFGDRHKSKILPSESK